MTMPVPDPRTVTALLLALGLGIFGGCAAEPAAAPGIAETPPAAVAASEPAVAPETGRVVAAPDQITRFAPEARTAPLPDLDVLDLKQVFEATGPDTALWYQHVQTLANPFFEGRVNGSAGTERARAYMEFYFRLYGLQPAFAAETADGIEPGGADSAMMMLTSYDQPFEFRTRGRTEITIESARAAIGADELVDGADFVVLGNSASGSVTAPLTFVGYGIDGGPGGYTSFDDDTDLSGRIAMLLRYEPLGDDGTSRWSDERFSARAGLAPKMRAVAARGAAGIVLVNPPGAVDGATGLAPLSRSRRFGRALEIPVFQIAPDVAERLLAAGDPDGADLMARRRDADTGAVRTVPLSSDTTLTLAAELTRTRSGDTLPARNVGAILPGAGSLADEYLVIGGHYDHNGYGQFGTTPESGPLFPGADDNASGIAGMLVLAKKLSEHYASDAAADDRRSVLFIAFDAEERGLHGSRHFASNPTVEPEQMTALLNMDMIGRLRNDELSVLGTGTAEGLPDILRPHFERSGLTVAVSARGSGRSDDANFDRIGVPAMHFFTGMHSEYTTPADHAWTVNPIGAGKIMDMMYGIALDLASRPEQLEHVDARAAAPRPGQDRGYAPVRLGIRPGMNDTSASGIMIESVSAGTSAAESGLLGGDLMLRWGELELDGMRTLVELLRESKPGDTVPITVLRDGREVVVPVTLKASEG